MIEEGIFISSNNELDEKTYSFFEDEKRPQESFKTSQKYFRQNEEYNNQFIQLSEADDLYKEIIDILREYSRLSQIQNGQRILEEGPKREKKKKIEGEEEE